jgi:hypothetical protein
MLVRRQLSRLLCIVIVIGDGHLHRFPAVSANMALKSAILRDSDCGS